MKTKIVILLLIITYSCHRYGNFRLKNEILNENQIYYENKLDYNAVYFHKIINNVDSSSIYSFVRFFPNGRMYIQNGYSKIETNEEEYFNRINNTNNFMKGQKTYYVFLDSNRIKYEFFENPEFGYYYVFAYIRGDTIDVYKTKSQSIINNTNYPQGGFWIKKTVDLKPVEVDW